MATMLAEGLYRIVSKVKPTAYIHLSDTTTGQILGTETNEPSSEHLVGECIIARIETKNISSVAY